MGKEYQEKLKERFMAENSQLTSAQRTFIATVSARIIDEEATDKKFDLIWENDRKCARLENIEIPINLTDSELLNLASLGYTEMYLSSTPKSIVFKKSILQQKTDMEDPDDNKKQALTTRVLDVDIIQVYVWLGACLVFAIIALILLVVTIDGLIAHRISTTVASGIITIVTTIASAIFFRNYDKSNDRLKNFRSDRSPKRR
jgi:hypothetical protein